MICRSITVLSAIIGAAVVAVLYSDRHPALPSPISSTQRYSQSSFSRWLAEEPDRRLDFASFENFLADNRVSGVVPNWQLLRTDINDRIGCPRPAFLIPPKSSWANIVPTLRLVKDEIIPVIGPVEVASSFRTSAFNDCVGGAKASRHLGFSAVDLVATRGQSNWSVFAELCRIHRALGPQSQFGLGAYFDPQKDDKNSGGRFHVDATGYRTWGFGKTAQSSGCKAFAAGQDNRVSRVPAPSGPAAVPLPKFA